MKRYILFFLQIIKNIFNPAISVFSRVEYSTVSRKAKIWRFAKLDHATVGDYTYIGPKAKVIHASIGKFCSIAGNSSIGLALHPLNYISTSPIFFSFHNATGYRWLKNRQSLFNEYKSTILGNDVWIGSGAMILGGVSIGDGAVVGAGAIVTKDVPPYAIVGGVPAKIIKYRFNDDIINELNRLQWWDKSDEYLKRNIHLFQTTDLLKISELE